MSAVVFVGIILPLVHLIVHDNLENLHIGHDCHWKPFYLVDFYLYLCIAKQ